MITVKQLIAEGRLDEAADVMLNCFRILMNRNVTGLDLTREEFATLAPAFAAKLQDPTPTVKEPTDAPGDDVVVSSSKATFVVTFVGPEDDEEFVAPKDYSELYNIGAKYSYVVPLVHGYVPDQDIVTGKMEADGVEVTITYEKVEVPDEDPEVELKYGTVDVITKGGSMENGSADPEVVVNFSGATLDWSKANPSAGRTVDGWWLGIKMTAPADMTTEDQFATVTYMTKGSTGWSAAKSFWNNQDSKKAESDTTRFIQLWGVVDPDKLKAGNPEYAWKFDWNGDGEYEQIVTMKIDGSNITLNKDGSTVYPEPEKEEPKTATLTIKCQSSEKDFPAPADVTKEIVIGEKYNERVPEVPGFYPSSNYVTGTMKEGGVVEIMTYDKVDFEI